VGGGGALAERSRLIARATPRRHRCRAPPTLPWKVLQLVVRSERVRQTLAEHRGPLTKGAEPLSEVTARADASRHLRTERVLVRRRPQHDRARRHRIASTKKNEGEVRRIASAA
jgi:hypothetical protein